jgi:hypothetical protein
MEENFDWLDKILVVELKKIMDRPALKGIEIRESSKQNLQH